MNKEEKIIWLKEQKRLFGQEKRNKTPSTYNSEYYKNNKEKFRVKNRKYREEHREELIEYQRQWRAKSRLFRDEEYIESRRQYKQRPDVKAKTAEYMRKYNQRPGAKEKKKEYREKYRLIERQTQLQNMPTLYCKECNIKIEPEPGTGKLRIKYCSTKCGLLYNNKMRPARILKHKTTKNCIICNNTFESYRKLTCSNRCRLKDKKDKEK